MPPAGAAGWLRLPLGAIEALALPWGLPPQFWRQKGSSCSDSDCRAHAARLSNLVSHTEHFCPGVGYLLGAPDRDTHTPHTPYILTASYCAPRPRICFGGCYPEHRPHPHLPAWPSARGAACRLSSPWHLQAQAGGKGKPVSEGAAGTIMGRPAGPGLWGRGRDPVNLYMIR